MDKAQTLLELAERCERTGDTAELGSLNGDVLRGLGWRSDARDIIDPDGNVRLSAPYVVGSLDAAMTLVPDGLRWCVDTCGGRPHSFIEDLTDFSEAATEHKANAATPALALCAASLRALASGVQHRGE